jgi:formylglycine-generating enzyme required for sulfatase activity
MPVSSFDERKSPSGALNMAGNAWEWTASANAAGTREFDDMRKVLGSDNFSRSWFDIKGGAFSPKGSAGFRLYLHRGFPEDQHSPWIGFRCAKSVTGSAT